MNILYFMLPAVFILLSPRISVSQVEIEFNGSHTQPQLLLTETADDYARLHYRNTNSNSAFWSLMGKIGNADSLSRFRLFYEGFDVSAAPLVVTGNLRFGIGMMDPPARLSLKQASDTESMGFRIVNAASTGSGRMWLNGNDLLVYAGSNEENGLTFKPTGRIGAFTDAPAAKFNVFGSDDFDGKLFLVNKEIHIGGSFYDTIRILEANTEGEVFIRRLGVQEDSPNHQLDVNTVTIGENPFRVRVLDDTKFRVLSNGGASIGSGNPTPPEDGLYVEGDVHTGNGSGIVLRDNTGTISISLNADISGKGRVVTDELEITGGSDLSEMFAIQSSQNVPAGTVVSIDPRNPGKLRITTHAFDTRVVGVVSGANGIASGLIMGQKGTIAYGEYPVALAGRVYVKAEAVSGSIDPGDLLTTSDLPGHVKKLTNRRKSHGSIVGKALTSLGTGKGEVLMLICLQ